LDFGSWKTESECQYRAGFNESFERPSKQPFHFSEKLQDEKDKAGSLEKLFKKRKKKNMNPEIPKTLIGFNERVYEFKDRMLCSHT